MDNLNGVINIYKEKGFTSHDVVNIIRNTLNKVKTGHTGTLDPDACGVLPICIGKATKISEYIMSDIKEYRTEITLGISTSTQDASGKIIEEKEINLSSSEITEAILSFKGELIQTPPMFSAIKVNGKRLYEFAREGKEIERKKRQVKIYDINIEKFISYNKIIFDVICSKGTYIRTLCNDIGIRLGCGAHMSELLRTRSGNFFLKDSIKISDFKNIVANNEINKIIMPIELVMSDYKKVVVPEKCNKYLYNGNKININFISGFDLKLEEKFFVYDFQRKLIGIYIVEGQFIRPLTMLI